MKLSRICHSIIGSAALCVAALICGIEPPAESAPPAAQKAKPRLLLMPLNRTGNFEIYLMTEDGKKFKNLTNNPAEDGAPEWSPDGKKIVFTSTRNSKEIGRFGGRRIRYPNIYVMDADGKNVKQLTRDANDYEPTWSPDGKKIAFRRIARGVPQVFVMNADGSGQVSLTKERPGGADPAWSRDGKKLAFSRRDLGGFYLYLMDADGSNVKRLLPRSTAFTFPAWSPDGKKITYTAYDLNNSLWDLFVYDFAKKSNKQLTKLPGINTYAAWSPDGKRITFLSFSFPLGKQNGTLYMMNADGSNQRKILTGIEVLGNGGSQPSWRPNKK